MDTTKLRKIAQEELEIIKDTEKRRKIKDTEKRRKIVPRRKTGDPKDNFDLDDFLKNYIPKSSEDALKLCLKNKKLKGYNILSKKTIKEIIPGKTYIKYIKNTANYDVEELQSGGIFVAGGISQKNGFKHMEKSIDWTHLMLKICKYDDNSQNDADAYVFVIKISNFHIFYKLFDEILNGNSMRDFIVELKRNVE